MLPRGRSCWDILIEPENSFQQAVAERQSAPFPSSWFWKTSELLSVCADGDPSFVLLEQVHRDQVPAADYHHEGTLGRDGSSLDVTVEDPCVDRGQGCPASCLCQATLVIWEQEEQKNENRA
jgi:hypothetical protein